MTDSRRYYDKLWTSDAWGSRDVNADERLRLGAILGLLKRNRMLRDLRPASLRILDVGCGRGWLTKELAAYGSIIGVDPVPSAVSRARTLFPGLEFQVGTPEDLLLNAGAGRFDLIAASEVLEHVENREKQSFLISLRKLLAPNGSLVLTTPRGELWDRWKRLGLEEQPVEQWVTEEELSRLAERSGLRVIDRERLFLPGLWPGVRSRILSNRAFRRLINVVALAPALAAQYGRESIYQIVLLQATPATTASHGA